MDTIDDLRNRIEKKVHGEQGFFSKRDDNFADRFRQNTGFNPQHQAHNKSFTDWVEDTLHQAEGVVKQTAAQIEEKTRDMRDELREGVNGILNETSNHHVRVTHHQVSAPFYAPKKAYLDYDEESTDAFCGCSKQCNMS